MVESGDVIIKTALHAPEFGAEVPRVQEQEQRAGYSHQCHQLAGAARDEQMSVVCTDW